MSSESPDWPRSACEIALGETPASWARSLWLRSRRWRRLRSAPASRAAAGVASSRIAPSCMLIVRTLPSTPGGRPSAFEMRTRWSSTTSTHCVISSTSRRSPASASEPPIDQYAIAPISSSIGQQRAKNRRAISAPQRSAIASRGSNTRIVRSARPAYARTAESSSPGPGVGAVGRRVDHVDSGLRRRQRRRTTRARTPRPAPPTSTRACTNGSTEAWRRTSQTTLSPQKRPPSVRSRSAIPLVAGPAAVIARESVAWWVQP